MLPVRCYTCNALIADKPYAEHVQRAASPAEALARCAVHRTCCRRMLLGFVDVTRELLAHPNKDCILDEGGTVLHRFVRATRTVSCD